MYGVSIADLRLALHFAYSRASMKPLVLVTRLGSNQNPPNRWPVVWSSASTPPAALPYEVSHDFESPYREYEFGISYDRDWIVIGNCPDRGPTRQGVEIHCRQIIIAASVGTGSDAVMYV